MAAQTTETAPSAATVFGSDRMWGLKELPLPEPVSYWPQTPGWYVLALLLLFLIALIAWWRWRRWLHDAYRRDALLQLQEMADNTGSLSKLPALLRKTALTASRREDVASLRGGDWITWLNNSVKQPLFDNEDAELIDQLPYATSTSLTALLDEQKIRRLLDASQTWVKDHRVTV